MRPKYRNPGDRFRSGQPFSRSRSYAGGGGGGSFSRSYSKPSNPPRKLDVLMEAGRLAAEYLVAKGVLPPSSMPKGGSHSGGRIADFRGHGRETPSQPQAFSDGRPWLRESSVPDSGHGRRRFGDYDSRMSGKGRKRMVYHSRDYDPEYGLERKRNGQWLERSGGGYADSVEEEDNSPPGYQRDRRARYDRVRSSVSRVTGDEQQPKIEVTGETGSELDDAGSKASSDSRRKEVRPEEDAEINKGMDDVMASKGEAVEVNSGENEEAKVSVEAEMEVKPSELEEEATSSLGNYLSELCGFAKVPRKPRSSRFLLEQGPGTEASAKVEGTSSVESKMAEDEVPADGFSIQVGNSKDEALAVPHGIETKEEDSQGEMLQSTECLGTPVMPDSDPRADDGADISQVEEIRLESKLPQSGTLQNEFSQLGDVKALRPSLVDMPSQGEQMIEEISQLEPVCSLPVAKADANSFVGMEEENQNQSSSFKICDLNLMEAPEINEIPDDPVQPTAANTSNTGYGNSRVAAHPLEGDGRVIPIINLEDDSLEVNNPGPSRPKNTIMYSDLENVYNHTSHSDDIPVFAISDYLGADISCSPAQSDLNNLQAGMALNGSEGFPGVDDAIYGSLGDIGFMEVWDQPTHDYEKFF